jgi:hypothetical protein
MRSFLAAATVALATLTAPTVQAADRGELIASERIAHLSRAETAKQVGALTLSTRPIRHGVDAFRLTYATVDARGAATTATGLLVLPRTRAWRLRTVSYDHGTMAARRDAPSRSLDSLAGASVLLFGGAGFATAAPDYLGLGRGPGPRPYVHAASEASASLDMLRAAHSFAAQRGRALDPDTLVTGFSQGGQAAMALARLLQDGADARLGLRALAPMSGPYDLEHAQLPASLAGSVDSLASNYYITYGMLAWQPLYHVYDRPQEVWRGPWAQRVAGLYDGRHDDVAIMRVLPRRLPQLFTRTFLARLAHPDGGLAAGLRDNDTTCDWNPTGPVRLFAARRDRQVAFVNSRHCLRQLRAHGSDARLVDVGPVDHFPSTLRATPRVVSWFGRLR